MCLEGFIFFQSDDIVKIIDALILKLSVLRIILKCDSHKHMHILVYIFMYIVKLMKDTFPTYFFEWLPDSVGCGIVERAPQPLQS